MFLINLCFNAAPKDLKQIVQEHPDPDLTFVKLQPAEFCGAGEPAGEEGTCKELQEKHPEPQRPSGPASLLGKVLPVREEIPG